MTACICAVLWPGAWLGTQWLQPVRSLFATGEPGPVPPNASNTIRTLRSLYIALDHPIAPYGATAPGRVQEAPAIQSAVLSLLQEVTPYLS